MEYDASFHILNATDGIAFLVFLGITSGNQHHTNGSTLVKLNLMLVEITFGNTLEQIDDIALQA